MRRVSLLWSFLVLAPWLWAQSPSFIAGIVVDSTGAVLPRASVRLLDPTAREAGRTLTDSSGHFRFDQAANKSYQVQASLTGFRTTAVAAEAGSELKIVLQVAPVREYVTVTADRTETPTSLTGAATTVLDQPEIEDRQQLLASSLLQSVPGVMVVRSGGLGTVTSVLVRGGESNYNKILLDGIPLNEPGGTFEFSNLAEEDLDRVEIVRGPQSALFGSDAMASTIQFFSHRGNPEDVRPRVSLGFEAGKFQTLHGRAGLSGGYRRFDYTLGWSRLETDNQEPNNAFHNSTLSGNFGLSLGKNTTARLVLRGDFGRAGTPGQTAFERPDSDAFFRKADGYAGIGLQNQTSSKWNQKLTYTYARTRQVSRDLFIDPPFTPTFEGHTAPFEFFDFPFDFLNDARREHLGYQSDVSLGSVSRVSGQHLVTLAFDWDRESAFIADRLAGTAPTRAERNNFGGTLQDQVIWGRVVLTNGFRVEDNGSFGRTVVPRTSASYLVRQHGQTFGATRLKFNFGLGIKEPTFIQSFSPDPSFAGNPNLRPERARSFDYGIEQRLWGDRAKVELNGFNNVYREIIAFQTVSFVPFQGTFFNLAQSRADGAEIIVEASPHKGVRLGVNYTFLQGVIERSSQPDSPVFRQGQQLFRRPRHSGSAFAAWDWKEFTVTSNLVFVGQRVDSDSSSLEPPIISDPSYTKWDLGWNYRSGHRITYFGIFENVLDQHYMEALGFPALPASYRAGARIMF